MVVSINEYGLPSFLSDYTDRRTNSLPSHQLPSWEVCTLEGDRQQNWEVPLMLNSGMMYAGPDDVASLPLLAHGLVCCLTLRSFYHIRKLYFVP